jgi:hypothetical protein
MIKKEYNISNSKGKGRAWALVALRQGLRMSPEQKPAVVMMAGDGRRERNLPCERRDLEMGELRKNS